MNKNWIKIGLLSFLCCASIGIGISFGFKDKIYIQTTLDTQNLEITLTKEEYNKLKNKKFWEIKINDKIYQTKFKKIKELETFYLVKTNFDHNIKEKLVNVSIFQKTQPIIYSMIDKSKF